MIFKEIILASNNINKINEIKELLKPLNINIKTLKDLGLDDPVENGKDFIENSLIKANYAFERTGLPSLADDSGFCIESLNNFPGLVSARFANSCGNYENAFKILNACINPNNRNSSFITCLSFVYNNQDSQKIKKIFKGNIKGQFIYPPRGNNGFGYCPCFMPNWSSETFGEISNELRMKKNHRSIALNKFVKFLKSLS